MAILKCKICGGDIEVSSDKTLGTCQYCGTTMTIPKIDTDKKARLYNRAIQYLNNCEFDKAYSAYESIASEDEQEAEAYWGMILSEYGIEYVEDPRENKRIPTCHRTIPIAPRKTTNYDLAIKYATEDQKSLYEKESEEIERIQSSIKAISSKEEPYDVFICYKETDDETGDRTQDSVLAFDIFEELEKRGLNVFFSRVTLSEKPGTDYEPYIYSALSSAKVMFIVSCDANNLDSIWVINEWSRYLKMINEGQSKIIIPVLKGVNVDNLPAELRKFQAYDMTKIGALQDLGRSVYKLLENQRIEEKESMRFFKKKTLIIASVIIAAIAIMFILLIPLRKEETAKKSDSEIVSQPLETPITVDDGIEVTKPTDTQDDDLPTEPEKTETETGENYFFNDYSGESDKSIDYCDGYYYYTYNNKIYKTTGPEADSELFEKDARSFLIYNKILYAIKTINRDPYERTISAYSLDGTIRNDDITGGVEKNAYYISAIDDGTLVYEYDPYGDSFNLAVINTIDNENLFRNSIEDIAGNHLDVFIDGDDIFIAFADAYEPGDPYDFGLAKTDITGAGYKRIHEEEYPFSKHDPNDSCHAYVESVERDVFGTLDNMTLWYIYHDFGILLDYNSDSWVICNLLTGQAKRIDAESILGGVGDYIAYVNKYEELVFFDCNKAFTDMESQLGELIEIPLTDVSKTSD